MTLTPSSVSALVPCSGLAFAVRGNPRAPGSARHLAPVRSNLTRAYRAWAALRLAFGPCGIPELPSDLGLSADAITRAVRSPLCQSLTGDPARVPLTWVLASTPEAVGQQDRGSRSCAAWRLARLHRGSRPGQRRGDPRPASRPAFRGWHPAVGASRAGGRVGSRGRRALADAGRRRYHRGNSPPPGAERAPWRGLCRDRPGMHHRHPHRTGDSPATILDASHPPRDRRQPDRIRRSPRRRRLAFGHRAGNTPRAAPITPLWMRLRPGARAAAAAHSGGSVRTS